MSANRSPGLGLYPIVVAGALLGLVEIPVARADPIDTTFLGALNSKGIDFLSGQDAVIAGHEVCDELDAGRAKSDVVSEVMQSSRLDGYHAGFFVGVSISAFCPRHHG
ncbi:DUF732 domain-containing protein [Mycolicibacter minnesotensis]